MQAESQCLRHWTDQIDCIVSNESEDRACSENEHQRDDGSGDDDRPTDVTRRGMSFTGQNANVFETTQCADCQLGEDVEAIEDRHRRRGDL